MKVGDLAPSSTYKITLVSESLNGLKSKPNLYTFTTSPDPPVDFKASKVSSNDATLTWIKPIVLVSSVD